MSIKSKQLAAIKVHPRVFYSAKTRPNDDGEFVCSRGNKYRATKSGNLIRLNP